MHGSEIAHVHYVSASTRLAGMQIDPGGVLMRNDRRRNLEVSYVCQTIGKYNKKIESTIRHIKNVLVFP